MTVQSLFADPDARPLKVLKLKCKVQNYDWGIVGPKSTVARLYALQSSCGGHCGRNAGVTVAAVDDDDDGYADEKPYAELWMGTHDSGPSSVILEDEHGDNAASVVPLKEWLCKNPQALGDKVLKLWGANLPFLFKVLSISKALSIQAHPDKKLAEKLHLYQPKIYKDANHKPEMALAISNFEALCGFASSQEIKQVMVDFPELQTVLGKGVCKSLIDASLPHLCKDETNMPLRTAFRTMMSTSEDVIANVVTKIVLRLRYERKTRTLSPKEHLILRLADQYPGDVGVLSAFFLNYLKLVPGEALYLDANEPHAYISGECVECMATSDNVVRAGLTPKYKDTQTLCSMLSYKQEQPTILSGVQIGPHMKRYSPPFQEFEVDHVSIMGGTGEHVIFPAIPGPSVMLVLEGEGTMSVSIMGNLGMQELKVTSDLKKGNVCFIPAGLQLQVTASVTSSLDSMLPSYLNVYRAGVSSSVLVD